MKTVIALILVCSLATASTAQMGTSDAQFMAMMKRFFQMFSGGGVSGGTGGNVPPSVPPTVPSGTGGGTGGTGGAATKPPCTGGVVCMPAAYCDEPEPGFHCSTPGHICCDD